MQSVLIRNAFAMDIPTITAIYAHAVAYGTATFEIDPPTEDDMAMRRNALVDGGFPYVVVEFDGEVVGYAYAAPYRTRPAYRYTVEDSIYVAPSATRRGVGQLLLNRLIQECERLGFRQMVAVIGDSAQNASIELHRAAGFRMIGTVENVGFKFNRWLDTVLMQRALGPGATNTP